MINETVINETKTSAPDGAAEAAADDPIRRHAHALAKLAFEQETKPVVTVRDGANGFVAVLGLFEHHLRAGRSVGALEAGVRSGAITVWTVHGISTALAQRQPRSGGNRTIDALGRMAAEL